MSWWVDYPFEERIKTSEVEELRAEYLADAQEDLAGNEPGNFGCHEEFIRR